MSELKEEIEAAARAIYEHRYFGRDGGNLNLNKPAWMPRGNSFMQDEARDFARVALLASGLPIALERVKAAEALIQESAAQFRYYEKQHRAKQTPEADAKAEVNEKLAEAREAFLRSHP